MMGNYLMLYSGVSQGTRAQSGIALRMDHKWLPESQTTHLSMTV
jgi:hypothetical protein